MKNNKKIKKTLTTLIPVFVAIIVLIVFAISGKVASKNDMKNPDLTTQAPEVVDQAPVEQDGKVTMVSVGDNLIHNTVFEGAKTANGFDFKPYYENIAPIIKSADIATINQETMLGGNSFEYSGYPLFNSPWEVGDACIDAGFDIYTCATNHALDKGVAGINREIEYFSSHPEVVQLGVNDSQEKADTITYYEKNNIKFALLSYTYGTNGIPVPDDKPYCVNMLTEERVTKDVNQARQNADVVIVFPHWGTENTTDIDSVQKKYVEILSNLGVDIIIGTGPHVIQQVEWYNNPTTGKNMLVYYSLGNFLSHQINKNQLVGGMAQITIEKKNGEISITNTKLAPFVCHYKKVDKAYKFNIYMLEDYTQELANSHAQKGITPEYCKQLCKDVVSEEFLNLN